jgi:peptide/nickel transport system substrate-binding protein
VLPLYQPYESFGLLKKVNWKPLPGHIPYVLDFRAGQITLDPK